MKHALKIAAIASLGLLTVPTFLFLTRRMSLPCVKLLMLIATVLSFVCTLQGMWIDKEKS